MAYNLPIAENFNPYDSASLIRSKGTSGALVDQPIDYRPAPTQSPVPPASYPVSTPSAATGAPVAAPEPTIAETLQGIKDKALGVQAQLNARNSVNNLSYDTGPTYEQLYPTINEKDIQRNQMRLFQKEIDATNRVYSDMLSQERLAGQGRLGSQTAMAARGGLLGSDFGEAQRQTQVTANLGAERAVENERLAKIGTIMGTMRKAVSDEIANKRLARQQDAESYSKYLAGGKERKVTNTNIAAQAILDAGLDAYTMDQSEIEAIAKEANLSVNDILTGYKRLKEGQDAAQAEAEQKSRKFESDIANTEADTASKGFFNLSEGQSRYDAQGNVIASKAKTYSPNTGTSGLFSKADTATAVQTLEESRGAKYTNEAGEEITPTGEDADFVNTGVYLNLMDQATGSGVPVNDFLKEFPPKNYLNPNDASVPAYVKASMKAYDPMAQYVAQAIAESGILTQPPE